MKKHLALYGEIAIPRAFCVDCDQFAFIIDGKYACCDKVDPTASKEIRRRKRMSDVASERKGPSKKWKEKVLEEQDYRCVYCIRKFGSIVYRGNKPIRLKLNWDHVDPWAFSLNNKDQNFVAACHVCNGIKSSMIFASLEAARVYIEEKRKAKGYRDTLQELRDEIHPTKKMAKVLQPSL